MVRVKTKTEVATIKLTPNCRRAWEAAAASERRSLANMFEVALLEYCERHGVEVPAPVKAATTAKKSAAKKSAVKRVAAA
ncbi:hypothetical protein [Variovorax paradoxus]|uniref:hypothetical protein n=1 Tax=Variovorax paradoxus TaxID=34073 RepID=UPI0019332EAC|nr:hypothetical protein INQ48_43120 [Variovorax paradoxus]